ncbi:hypothetical protein GGR54DRAFT_630457 [Hypoxylon sp. NC1633]|nr:hypothetical protein GGR54DRAFT_630457 [Hypoxylon sp. NC1633]
MQQSYSKELMIGLAIAFIIVPSIFVGLRIWARLLKFKALQFNDYLCLGALVVGFVCSALQLYAAIDGRLGQHQIVGPDGQPILDDPGFIVYENTKFVVNILSVISLGLFAVSDGPVYGMLGVVAAWTISYFFANLFTCFPVTPFIEAFYGNNCIDSVPMWLSVVISDLIVDVGILLMPVPMVLQLQLPWKERLGVLGMFMLGASVCGISATRIATLVQIGAEFLYHYNDETYYTSPVFYWSNIELAMAVVSACLPTLRPIWGSFVTPRYASSAVYSYAMKFVFLSSSFFGLAGLALASPTGSSTVIQQLHAELGPQLSHQDIISTEAPPRWSTFNAPHPAIVVNVESELDVAVTVKYCSAKGLPFLAQNGGSGWATTFKLGTHGVLINLARLNQVTFNTDKTQATIGGGSNNSNTISHAYAAGALVETGNCDCVGTLGATLGGGYGNLVGLYGLGVDNVISMRVVTADGHLRSVTASSDPDLFWGLRGAGPNLGIVTSAVVKSHPASQDDLHAWTGSLIFSPDNLEEVVQAIQDLKLQPDMNIFLYFISGGPPANEPVVLVTPFLHKGNAATGRAAFASLYAIATGFCTPGGRKPSYGAGFQRMIPATWRQIWNEYVEFQKRPTAENSVVLLEAYSLIKARSEDPNSAAFPHRNVNFNAVAIPWYNDTALDDVAQAFGGAARDLWRATDGLTQNSTYVNFAHGDEALQVIFGKSLAKLHHIKQRFDPHNRFNQWFSI